MIETKKRKNIYLLCGLVLVSMALAACTAQPVEPLPGSEAFAASATIRPTVTQTLPATATLTPAPSITPSPTPSVAQECFEQHSKLPAEIIPPGQLVIDDGLGLAIIDFSQSTQRKIDPYVASAGVSPDGNWLAYSSIDYLHIESADGSQSFQIPEKRGWYHLGSLLWLDNERLWFAKIEDDRMTSVVVLNPFSGEEEWLEANYPNLKNYYWSGPQGLINQFDYSHAAYDPSLRYVIYPEYVPNEGYFLTLWDRTTQRAIARMPTNEQDKNLPVWDETQQRFLIVAYPDSDSRLFEWISVGLDGTVERLTQLGEYASEYKIGNFAKLSPDGKTLAFTFVIMPEGLNQPWSYHLFLLNLKTGDVTDTCLSAYPKAFSADSQFLAIRDASEAGGTDSIRLLHLKTRQSYKILEQNNASVYGWLNAP